MTDSKILHSGNEAAEHFILSPLEGPYNAVTLINKLNLLQCNAYSNLK